MALYRGDVGGNGQTYLTVAGHRTDAPPVGAFALVVAILLITGGVAFVRRSGE